MAEAQTAAWQLSGFGDEIDPDPIVQIAVLQALGASHIEVRSAWGINVLELSSKQLAELAELFATKGIGVSAIASPIGKVDVELPVEHEVGRLRLAIAAAQTLGSRYIRIFSFQHEGREPEAVRDDVMLRMAALAKTAEDAGVVLLHENEMGIFGDVPSRVLDLVQTTDSPALRLAWDAGNFVRAGIKPFDEAYGMLRPYLDYLQVKDAIPGAGSVPAGDGAGQIRETVEALLGSGYSGFASLEPHLAHAGALGGFSGPAAFGAAARAFRQIMEELGGTVA